MSTTYIGIDNATSGALAVLPNNAEPFVLPFVTLPKVPKQSTELDDVWFHDTMRDIANQYGPVRVVVERAQKFSAGILALCSTWACYGSIRAILRVLKLPLIPIDPKTWQAAMFRGLLHGDTKAKSLLLAKQLYPNVCLRRSLRCTTECDGMSDALLIATYGKNNTL